MGADGAELLLRLELTHFFEANPFVWESAGGLAGKLGRQAQGVGRALEGLAARGLVDRRGEGSDARYRYRAPAFGWGPEVQP